MPVDIMLPASARPRAICSRYGSSHGPRRLRIRDSQIAAATIGARSLAPKSSVDVSASTESRRRISNANESRLRRFSRFWDRVSAPRSMYGSMPMARMRSMPAVQSSEYPIT